MAGILDLVGRGLSGAGILGGGDSGDQRMSAVDDPNFNQGKQVRTGLFNRPGASEALLAFGANMLAAPSFGEGIGAGTSAFLDTLREEEERRKPKTQFLADGAVQASIDPMTGEVSYADVEPVQKYQQGLADSKANAALTLQGLRGDQGMDKALAVAQIGLQRQGLSNDAAWQRAMLTQNGAMNRAMLLASTRGQNITSPFEKGIGKVDADRAGKGYDMYLAASEALPVYAQLRKQIQGSGAGPGAIQGGIRQLAQGLGMDIGDVDLSNKNFADSLLSQIELNASQGQRGLGQLTEMERAIIRRSIPNLAQDPQAFNRVLNVLEANAIRNKKMFEGYARASARDPGTSYIGYSTKWLKNYNEALSNEISKPKRTGAAGSTSTTKKGVGYTIIGK